MKRILIAIFASTVAATFVTALFFYIPAIISGDDSHLVISDIVVFIYGMSIFVGVLVIGLPTHLLLSHYSINTWLPYAAVGFLVPFIIIFIFKPYGDDPFRYLLTQGAVSGGLGVICASVFWYVASKPNKSSKTDAASGAA